MQLLCSKLVSFLDQQVLFGGQGHEVRDQDGSHHASSGKDPVEEGEGRLTREIDAVVVHETAEVGG